MKNNRTLLLVAGPLVLLLASIAALSPSFAQANRIQLSLITPTPTPTPVSAPAPTPTALPPLDEYGAVFLGTVRDVKQLPGGYDGSKVAIEVKTSWKGVNAPVVTLRTSPLPDGVCGFVFLQGRDYLVYAHRG